MWTSVQFRFFRADGQDTVFDRTGPRLLLRDAGAVNQPFVCARVTDSGTERVKIINTKGSFVYKAPPTDSEPFVKVQKFSTNPKFPRNYFGLGQVNFPFIENEVGIFRTRSGGDLEAASDDLCVKIPIKDYNVVDSSDNILRSVTHSTDPEDCVSFRSVVPKILIDATWQSSDDFDVSLQEPAGGELIDFSNTQSAAGSRLNLDQNVGRCGEDPDGREQIRYLLDSSPLSGEYTVTLRHSENCDGGATAYSLFVIVDGEVVASDSGTSSAGDNEVVTTLTFTI